MTGPQVNPVAAAGFTNEVGAYERSRPSYPQAVLDVLTADGGLRPGAVVLDLAAGTGKLTRLLSPSGARVLAVEPVTAMAATFLTAVAGVPIAAGLAEALPVRSGSVDLLTVAQAFHWFDQASAFAECRRVLRPGGRLALVWNERDESVDWVAGFTQVVLEHGGARPYVRDQDWASNARAHGFDDVAVHRFPNPVPTDRRGVVERAASTSFVAALPDDRRAAALAAVDALVADRDGPFDFPHTTELTLAVNP